MGPATRFDLVSTLGMLLVPAVVFAVLALPRPRSFWTRSLLAIAASWLCTVLFMSIVYNPAAISAGNAAGQHFPEASYDNNTVAIAIMFGWFCPSVVVALITGIRFLWLRRHRSAA